MPAGFHLSGEPPGRPGVLAAPLGTPCRRAEAPGSALTCNRGCIFRKRALRGHGRCPLDSHLSGSLPAGRGARHPWEPLPCNRRAEAPRGPLDSTFPGSMQPGGCIFPGPRPPERALRGHFHGRCPLDSHLSGEPPGRPGGARRTPGNPLPQGRGPRRRTYMQPEVAFSVSAPSGATGDSPFVPTFREPPGRPGVLAAPLGTPCRRAEAPGVHMQPEVAFSVSAPSGGHGRCPLDSHLSGGASRQARGCSPHPWEPLAAGPRPPEGALTCNRRLHFP